ncbi:MAG: aspartate--tRNA ligase [Planctomycetota bacterium]
MKRTHTCGELRDTDAGATTTLCGWVASRRDHGGLVFVDLRDRYGFTQVVFDPTRSADAHKLAETVRNEDVIRVAGGVLRRPAGMENKAIATGAIEVRVDSLEVLNRAAPLPFPVDDGADISVELRLKHRYLDLRRPAMQEALAARHTVFQVIRRTLAARGFLEIETPFLIRSTPGGARNFLVPSRNVPGTMFALPESPQLFKQVLMAAGYDRYFQLVKCFRDEDLRADRQPEFTQLDLEMSFVEERDVQDITEEVIAAVFAEVKGVTVPSPFPRLSYEDAVRRFGSDKPDIRFGMEISDVGDIAGRSAFNVFKSVIAGGGCVRGFVAPGASAFSRKELDDLAPQAVALGAKGIAWCRVEGGKFVSPIAKFLDEAIQKELIARMKASDGDLLLFVADKPDIAAKVLGALRLSLGARLKQIPAGAWAFTWVVDFPLMEFSEEEKKVVARHHPFTSPRREEIEKLEGEPLAVHARAYDVVLNGVELGGGSIRIHDPAVQTRIFRTLGISDEEAERKFGFLLEAFRYGAPPHGGIALGMDRFVMLLLGRDSIRDTIAFPKTQKGQCLMTGAPAEVTARQLKELYVEFRVPPQG